MTMIDAPLSAPPMMTPGPFLPQLSLSKPLLVPQRGANVHLRQQEEGCTTKRRADAPSNHLAIAWPKAFGPFKARAWHQNAKVQPQQAQRPQQHAPKLPEGLLNSTDFRCNPELVN